MPKTILIPDPGFTPSEGMNVHAMLRDYLRIAEVEADAVIASALGKIETSMQAAMDEHPDALAAIEQETRMHARFRRERPDRAG
jgi:hypothetical protein